jgi:membrane-associated HD superfamily phosphohydrolase
MGANIKFKVDVKVKESFITRLKNLFSSERVVSVWLEENQASSASNYLYNEIKKLKKSFVAKTEEAKEDWEVNLEKAVGVKTESAKKKKPATKKAATPEVASGSMESSKPKRKYNRKPKKEQTIHTEK